MEIHKNEKEIASFILQIVTIYNAQLRGWSIKRLGPKKFELTKNYDESIERTFNMRSFLNEIISFVPNN
jgi:hypothetical protein